MVSLAPRAGGADHAGDPADGERTPPGGPHPGCAGRVAGSVLVRARAGVPARFAAHVPTRHNGRVEPPPDQVADRLLLGALDGWVDERGRRHGRHELDHPRPDYQLGQLLNGHQSVQLVARPERRRASRHRLAAALVIITLLHGVAVGLLLQRSSMTWGTITVRSLLAGPAPLGIGAGAWSDPGADAATGLPAGPGGPAPLPAESTPLPVGVSIPAIGVDESELVGLARAGDGSMEVPSDYARAGWFTGASTPGTPGPAIIAGHVDSQAGPAVFYRLRELEPGDQVTVRLAGGGEIQYVVDGVRRYPKTDFPTGTVFGPVPGSALRLITCGGSFDPIVRSYRDNIVVFASQRTPTDQSPVR